MLNFFNNYYKFNYFKTYQLILFLFYQFYINLDTTCGITSEQDINRFVGIVDKVSDEIEAKNVK